MPPYRLSEKIRALDCFVACEGDTRQASAQSGVPPRQLRRWVRQSAALRRAHAEYQRAAEQSLMNQTRLAIAQKALRLLEAIGDDQVDSAPLNQLVSAFGTLVDRYLKLVQQEADAPAEKAIRIEYQHPDGKVHPYPYWARHHPDIARAFQGGGVWPPLWQDRGGQADGDGTGPARQADVVAGADLRDGWPSLARHEDDDQIDERNWYPD